MEVLQMIPRGTGKRILRRGDAVGVVVVVVVVEVVVVCSMATKVIVLMVAMRSHPRRGGSSHQVSRDAGLRRVWG